MRSSTGRAGRVAGFCHGFGWLGVLAATIMVFGLLGEAAAQMRGRGFSAPRPAISHRGLTSPRMFGVRPGAMNRVRPTPHLNRPSVLNRNPRAVRLLPMAEFEGEHDREQVHGKDAARQAQLPEPVNAALTHPGICNPRRRASRWRRIPGRPRGTCGASA